MIHSQCTLEKDRNFQINQVDERRERIVNEAHQQHEKEIEKVISDFENNTYKLLKEARERKIADWEQIKVNMLNLMFKSTLVNSKRRSDVLKEIHEWLNDTCQGDVYVFEYIPEPMEKSGDANYGYASTALKSSSNKKTVVVEEYPDHNNIIFYFENKSDAMSFKLTWG